MTKRSLTFESRGGQILKKKYFVGAAGASLALWLAACGGSSTSDISVLPKDTQENVARVLWQTQYDESKIPADVLKNLYSPKNLPAARGARTQKWLDDLMANPDSCSPDYSDRYKALKNHAGSLSGQQAYAINLLLGPDSSRGYQEIPSRIDFSFPADDAPQNQYQVGWHFFVGSAYAQDGEEYGVQMMFWHYAMLPPAMAKAAGLSDLENQALELHLAVTRADGRHYRAKPYVVTGTTGLVQFSEAPFHYVQGKNYMRSRQKDSLFPIDLRAWGQDEAGSKPVDIGLNIGLSQTKGYVLNGDHGLSPACGGVGTLYYSVPNLRITDGSWLEVDGKKVQLASGKFWYDHQYGTGMLPEGNPRSTLVRAYSNVNPFKQPANPGGWDWLMLQFDDNTEMGLAALHTAQNAAFYQQTGPNPPGTMTAPVNGLFIDEKGETHPVTGQAQVSEWTRSTVSYAPYDVTQAWYPNGVKLVFDDNPRIPAARRVVHMDPIVKTGQQGWFAMGLQYSEGAVYLKNAQGDKVGRGFLESTGYANGNKQMLKLAGIPATSEMLGLLEKRKLNPSQQAACEALLEKNAAQVLEEIAQCKGI